MNLKLHDLWNTKHILYSSWFCVNGAFLYGISFNFVFQEVEWGLHSLHQGWQAISVIHYTL